MSENNNIPSNKINEQYKYMHLIRELNSETWMKAYIRTFGCQQNEADSELIAGMLAEMGYEITDEPRDASLILVNTCAIREHAELKALSITGQFKHIKAENPSLVIGVCGCMVSQEHRKNEIKDRYPYVDFIIGTGMLQTLPEILYTTVTQGGRYFYPDSYGVITEGLPIRRESVFKAWVSVMYGCDNFCSYCVVPYVRGRERSRAKDDILAEITELAKDGYKEITLLGQNVNSYGRDLGGAYDFADLLSDICKIDGDFIIRFMTSHPKDATRKLIDVMAENKKIAKQLHLPVQSGSDRVLDAMNRGYTRADYLSLIKYARERIPDIALSTDIIVGFPGEDEQDFLETLDILSKVRYDSIFSFIYSKREGTKAAAMQGQLSREVKSERFGRLLELQNAVSLEKNKLYENTTELVLVENRSKGDKTKMTGRNEKNRLVHFDGDDDLIGTWVSVKINKAETYALFGELII